MHYRNTAVTQVGGGSHWIQKAEINILAKPSHPQQESDPVEADHEVQKKNLSVPPLPLLLPYKGNVSIGTDGSPDVPLGCQDH